MSFVINSTTNLNKMGKIEQNQGRTFGPLMGMVLMNLFAKLVGAKYYSYVPVQLPYQPDPWLIYNKPVPVINHQYSSPWYPIKNPYHYQTYPTLTTSRPVDQISLYEYQDNYEYPSHYHDNLVPAESNNIPKVSTEQYIKPTTLPKNFTTTPKPFRTTTSKPVTTTTSEPVAAESNFNPRRQPTQRYKKRVPSRRDKYPQKRRRTTTLPTYYYDSYEYYNERTQPPRRQRPIPQSTESYYDDNEEYYDYETTTKLHKRKRRPTRKVNRNQIRIDESVEIITTERPVLNPNTEIVIVRQAAPTTTAGTTTTTTAGTTTTEPTTIITNTTVTSTTSGYNETSGYGPSNGNEHVSFTYAPPVANNYVYQNQAPYFDWYAHESTRNAIVKKVRDIVKRH